MTDSHIFPRAEVTECCEEWLPRDKSVLKNAEVKPDFVNCHSSICCQNRRANKASLWVPDKYLLPLLCHNAVCLCRHTRAVTKDVEVRMVPARALWCATHTQHPASETWVLRPSPLGRRDAEGTGHLFSPTVLSRPVFFLCLQFFAHLLMPISKASPHQPKRTQSSRRESTDHATQSQNPMSILRCLHATNTANSNGKIPNSHSS